MDGMEYEYLLRRVYQCGRHGVADADADIYRRFERAERTYLMDLENIKNNQLRISTKPIEMLERDYKVALNEIWRIVRSTLIQALDEYNDILSEAEIAELNSYLELKKATKQNIDNAIGRGNKILSGYKIFPQ